MPHGELPVTPGSYAQFKITTFDPDTGLEEAADAPPQLEIRDALDVQVLAPTSSILKSGTTAQYRLNVNIDIVWKGEYKTVWTWAKGTLTGRDTSTFHVREAEAA